MDTATMKYYFEQGLWTRERVDKLLTAGKISPEQYAEITGAEYAQ